MQSGQKAQKEAASPDNDNSDDSFDDYSHNKLNLHYF